MRTPAPGTPRVLLDATSVPINEGGVARYIKGLIAGLAHRSDIELHVAADPKHHEWISETNPHTVLHASPLWVRRPALRFLWEQTSLPRLATRIGASLVHSPHYTMPLFAGRPVVVTVHDATFFSHPHLHSSVKARFFRTWLAIASRRAACLIAPSHATVREVERHVGRSARRTVVAHHGVDHSRFAPPTAASIADFSRRHGLEGRKWIAFLGTIEPRKNVPSLIRAVDALDRSGRLDDDVVLLVAGARGWDSDVDAAISELMSPERVRLVGVVNDDDLASLLGGALCVVYPSEGEGFGLPVLEAMATGAPVLTTTRLALPEVGGDAVAYCEPDAGGIAAGIAKLLEDRPSAALLALAGRNRAADFTWESCAAHHLDAYTAVTSEATGAAR